MKDKIDITEIPSESAILRIIEKVISMKEKETGHVQIHKESNQ